MKPILTGIKNILLWSYARGSWQYDLLCLLIVTTIFLVPSRYFGDRDRVAPKSDLIAPATVRANEINPPASNASTSNAGETIHLIEFNELQAFLQRQNRPELVNSPQEALRLYLREQLRREVTIIDQERFTQDGRPGYRVRFK